jgi:hypothetical protein
VITIAKAIAVADFLMGDAPQGEVGVKKAK